MDLSIPGERRHDVQLILSDRIRCDAQPCGGHPHQRSEELLSLHRGASLVAFYPLFHAGSRQGNPADVNDPGIHIMKKSHQLMAFLISHFDRRFYIYLDIIKT